MTNGVIIFGPDGAQYRWKASGRMLPADLSRWIAGDTVPPVPPAAPVCNCRGSATVQFYGPTSVAHERSCPCAS